MYMGKADVIGCALVETVRMTGVRPQSVEPTVRES